MSILIINAMETSTIYILISIVALLIVVALLIFRRKNKKNNKEKIFTPLGSIAFAFIIAGILFGEDRLIGYSCIGVGVVLAVIDIIKKFKASKKK